MKPVFAAALILAAGLTATAQGNTRPGSAPPAPAQPAAPAAAKSALAQQAFNTCPALAARTESAAANGHAQYYYQADCECVASAIDWNTWDDASASYSGPKMADSDAYVIIGALASSPTIEDAFGAIDSNISEAGYSAVSACYGK